jgi:hypothetical protein
MLVHADDTKLNWIGGTPPAVFAVKEYGWPTHALGKLGEVAIATGSAI